MMVQRKERGKTTWKDNEAVKGHLLHEIAKIRKGDSRSSYKPGSTLMRQEVWSGRLLE
jgi:hypothetical protein